MPRVVLVVLLALVCGCGGSKEPTASDPTPTATASPTVTAENGLKRFSFSGFSMLVPADWKHEKDQDGVIFGAPDDKGAVGFYVQNSTYSAKDYVEQILLSGDKTRVLERDKVKVGGVGSGIAIRTTQSKDDDEGWWQLTAASIDGQLVSVMITPSPHLTDEQVDRMLHSVVREA